MYQLNAVVLPQMCKLLINWTLSSLQCVCMDFSFVANLPSIFSSSLAKETFFAFIIKYCQLFSKPSNTMRLHILRYTYIMYIFHSKCNLVLETILFIFSIHITSTRYTLASAHHLSITCYV